MVVSENEAVILDRIFKDINDLATWSVSTAKHGNGVHPLIDNDNSTFWQSDGVLPHCIDIVFPKLQNVACVAILLHGRTDDSYTPKKMVVRACCGVGDLSDVATVETQSPTGWVVVQLTQDGSAPPPAAANRMAEFADAHVKAAAEQLEHSPHAWIGQNGGIGRGSDALGAHKSLLGLFATHVQICILENHQQGRDTHIRGVKVFAPHNVAPFLTEKFISGSEIR